MRLRSIKLAGFKSFVESTHFQVPGQRVGIVGPNGCGKSNLIDAVRWVLGESRAAELRGESMQDVIFNGSGTRNPASRASVELVFENDGSAKAGPWSPYAEISVKRVLTRDGTSNYFINQQNVRRRDVQDIFLGTGLGPRAYAIIGQGMIARIIEAKPEELRVFLEEAAGVSKYKERRRETENRLSDARENLTRIEDIRRELKINLDKLEQQAAHARQYQALRAEHDETQHLLWLIQKNEAQADVEHQQQQLNAACAALDAQNAQLHETEIQLEILRAAHTDANDRVSKTQGALFEVQAEVSQFETEIHFVSESRRRAQAQIEMLTAQHMQWDSQHATARAELARVQQALADAQARHAQAQAAMQADNTTLPDAQTRAADAHDALTQAQEERARLAQVHSLSAAQKQNAEQLLQPLDARRERVQHELDALEIPDPAHLKTLHTQLSEGEAKRNKVQAHLAQVHETVQYTGQQLHAALNAVQSETALLHQYTARLEALQQVQRNVQHGGAIAPWLMQHNLTSCIRLWQKMHIEAGWEKALEAVLRERLGAFELPDWGVIGALAAGEPPAKLAFYTPMLLEEGSISLGIHEECARSQGEQEGAQTAPLQNTPEGFHALIEKVRVDDPAVRAVLTDALCHVYTAEEIEQACAARMRLPVGGVFVVPAGHQISRIGIQLYAADSEQEGVLARAQEIELLERQVCTQTERVEEVRRGAAQAETAQQAARQAHSDVSAQHEQLIAHTHALQLETQKHMQIQQSAAERRIQLEEARVDLDEQSKAQKTRIEQCTAQLEQTERQLAQLDLHIDEVRRTFDMLNAEQEQARHRVQNAERAVLEAHYAVRATEDRVNELNRSIQAAHEQTEQAHAALEKTGAELDAMDLEAPQRRLDAARAASVEKAAELATARTALDALVEQLRTADEARLKAQHAAVPLHEQIAELQLKEQAARLRRDQLDAQLQEGQADQVALAQKQSAEQTPATLQREVTRLSRAIDALGAINMAALEELTGMREREHFLAAQAEDLNAAMDTLENAIRTIDRETRQLLQHTFDAVNQHFSELFPRLFGGGQAKLTMTGDEILNTGVQVIAQPPGKKNATIHVLSGGEKALTATALVFALFQLNPAPFCLLDEVDAPLDDANTGRFNQLLCAMSERTQFLFITHNKQTMEIAQQLIGVTMQEQGVSRIVAVDVENML